MKADFSGYATKANLRCSDGRTIMPDAFKHQDQMQVPLVWMHGHTNPENILGHAILENRPDGVYTYGFFNDTPKAQHTKSALEHGDIKMLSIWANGLMERAKQVFHGAIREVSLVLSGANPGAVIENVSVRHSDDDIEVIPDEAIITTGLELEHSNKTDSTIVDADVDKLDVAAVVDTMNPDQREALRHMVGKALAHATDGTSDMTIQDVYDSMTPEQQDVLHYMVGQAMEAAGSVQQDNMNDDNNASHGDNTQEGNTNMSRNVFEDSTKSNEPVISHDDMRAVIDAGKRTGSLKHAMEEYALAHNITNIDQLFPDAKAINNTPEWISRRMEWVNTLLSAVRKSPFSKIKTLQADITEDDARAKGYIKGHQKKEEFFSVAKRSTGPTTIYKKQALDRDDVLDITDFDVVAWLKGEMRIMLDEELARAILVGDGRDISSEDHIDATCIRPIATDSEFFVTTLTANLADASSSMNEVLDLMLTNRFEYKGTGTPNFYTTEYWIAKFLLLRDGDGKRMYRSLDELAVEMRVAQIVPVEVMQEYPDIVGILVNPVDYVLGADRGGQVSMFDDFDIDYNKQKYLIETRVSGTLVKLKSAIVIKTTVGTNVLATPAEPAFVPATGVITIPTTTGVVYKNGAGTTLSAGAQSALSAGASLTVNATPASGYYFSTSEDDTWVFTRPA